VQQVASSYAVGVPGVLHFGLGDAAQVNWVRVEWPSGNVYEWGSFTSGQTRELREVSMIRPVKPSVSPGGRVVLAVSSTGATQWYHDGEELVGQTGVRLVLEGATADFEGRYSVVMTRSGVTTTNHTYLRVDDTFTKVTDSSVSEGSAAAWGANFVDIEGDGDLDLVVWNGAIADSLEQNVAYENDGSGGYTRVTAGDLSGSWGMWGGGAFGDLDNDGDVDAVAVNFESWPNRPLDLFLSDGGWALSRFQGADPLVTESTAGYPSLADMDGDGILDVAVGCGSGSVAKTHLFRGLGGGRFEQVLSGVVVEDWVAGAESLAWGDLDDDGDPDLVVCDFQGRKILAYWNVGGGRFERVVEGPLATVSGGALVAAFGDYDNDLRMDLFVSNYAGVSWLFHNEGGGEFSVTEMKTGAATGYAAWGDYDNDGDLDLMVATGQANAQPNLLYRNEAGVLLRVDIGSPSSELARTGPVVFGDIDNDGDLDLFEGNMSGERDALYRNNGNSNHWLLVNLRGTTSNRSAIGARVVVRYVEERVERRQMRELFGGNRSQQDPRAHFGFGAYGGLVDLEVLWPSGSRQLVSGVAVDQILEVVEPFAPELAGHILGEGRFELQFRTEGAKQYAIQESADLVIWTTVAVVTGNGDTVAWQDSAPAEERCFYRVQPR
jgi:hypothetical protein